MAQHSIMRALVIVFLISGSFLCQSKSYFAICLISFCLTFIIRLLYFKSFLPQLTLGKGELAVVKADLVLDDTEVEQKPGAKKPVENVWEGNPPLG